MDIGFQNAMICGMNFSERGLVPKFDGFSAKPKHKYLYSLIEQLDNQSEAVRKDMGLTFFDQSKLKIDEAGDFLNPVLCAFSNGTFMVLSTGSSGAYARSYLGPRYIQLVAWAFLPLPESKLNPGVNYSWCSFFSETSTVIKASHNKLIIADFHFIWQNKLQGASILTSGLVSLWKKGYDSITSLGSELWKLLNSCVMNLESLNLQNIPDITSTDISKNTKPS